jgi:hypothetical protein
MWPHARIALRRQKDDSARSRGIRGWLNGAQSLLVLFAALEAGTASVSRPTTHLGIDAWILLLVIGVALVWAALALVRRRGAQQVAARKMHPGAVHHLLVPDDSRGDRPASSGPDLSRILMRPGAPALIPHPALLNGSDDTPSRGDTLRSSATSDGNRGSVLAIAIALGLGVMWMVITFVALDVVTTR